MFVSATVLAFTGLSSLWAAPAMIYVSQDTFLKTSTAQASSLPAASKCAFTKGQALQISTAADGGAEHLRVTLPRAYTGCALTTGFLYSPHVSTNATAITVNVATVFKKTTADSSALPASSKCAMPVGVYPLSASSTIDGAHFKVNLKALLPSCSFSAGFIYDGHASAGVQQLSLADSLYLKKTTADSSTLPAASKCLIAKGNYAVTAAPGTSADHYSVSLVSNPAGCAFKSGFVFYALTYLARPNAAPVSTGYTKPLANGIQGSAWCVCRNIGTSPHIGQDWNADGAENSVAIANGTIVDKSFSSSCGHAVTLRDAGGADWIYRHLNSNSLTQGQAVTKGQFLGSHSTYPTSSCGSGAHLHIERRSAGAFADSSVFKSCEAGPEPCNFDPNKPFAAKAALQQATLDEVATENTTLAHCRTNPESYPLIEKASLSQYAAAGKRLNVKASRENYGEQARLTVAAVLNANPDNGCANGSCITALTVISVNATGEMHRVFHDSAVRDRAAVVVAEEEHCLAADVSKIIVLAKDSQGLKLRSDVLLDE